MAGDPTPVGLAGIVLPDALGGPPLDLGLEPPKALLTIIRHRHWLPCQEHLVRVLGLRSELERLGVTLVAVGFSPPAALAALARHLGWLPPLQFCSDEPRLLYDRLGLGRAAPGHLFTPATRAVYAAAVERGVIVERPDEDVRQLGGDALVGAGVARLTFRPSSPDDRPSTDELLAAARSLSLS